MKVYSSLIYFICVLILMGCAKNQPEKSILGRWEVEFVSVAFGTNTDPQMFDDFKSDLFYFKELTFYKDSIVYFDYVNAEDRLGTYFFEESISREYSTDLKMSHFPLKDTSQVQKFNFSNRTYSVEKFTRNKLILISTGSDVNATMYGDLKLTLKKTGKFE